MVTIGSYSAEKGKEPGPALRFDVTAKGSSSPLSWMRFSLHSILAICCVTRITNTAWTATRKALDGRRGIWASSCASDAPESTAIWASTSPRSNQSTWTRGRRNRCGTVCMWRWKLRGNGCSVSCIVALAALLNLSVGPSVAVSWFHLALLALWGSPCNIAPA